MAESNRICSVSDCGNPSAKTGLCNRHYLRLRRHGDVRGGGPDRARRGNECAMDGCARPAVKLGWCNKHYLRYRRNGDPAGIRTEDGAKLAWIIAHVDHQSDECLPWPFLRNEHGYGTAQAPETGKVTLASRIMCKMAHGPAPSPHHQSAHNCGKGHEGCANPNHLRWATISDNQMDRVEHGTSNRGERQWSSKLTADDVIAIRMSKGVSTCSKEAALYGVAPGTISKIRLRQRWAWL